MESQPQNAELSSFNSFSNLFSVHLRSFKLEYVNTL